MIGGDSYFYGYKKNTPVILGVFNFKLIFVVHLLILS